LKGRKTKKKKEKKRERQIAILINKTTRKCSTITGINSGSGPKEPINRQWHTSRAFSGAAKGSDKYKRTR
jgi:hypothetical protein